MEHRIEACPFVQILDAPVPQMGDQVVELLQKIVVGRSLRSSWWKCQLYLVMCWQSLPPSSIRGVRFVVVSQDSVQQRLVQSSSLILQFLRVGRGGGGGLQGYLPGQSPTAADVEQIVDIPARRGVQGFLSGQGSTASSSRRLHDDADEGIQVVFRTFHPKKVREWVRTRGRNCSQSRARPRSELMPCAWSPRRTSQRRIEEDCDLWVDEAWRQRMRTAAFPGRWYLLGTGFDGSIWWDEPGWGSWGATWGSRWLSAFFVACRFATTGAMGVLTEPGFLFMRQSTMASG